MASIYRNRLYTIGHSTRSYDELVGALRAWGVTTLVDIRSITRSRANPQFDAPALRRRLPRDGIAYVAIAALGGRRDRSREADPKRNAGWTNSAFKNYADHAETPLFREGLELLLERIESATCAIMCAEAVWWRCHRRIVADYLITRRVPVFHIFTARKATRATRTPFARVDRRRGTLRYPASTSSPQKRARRAAR